MGSRQLLSRLEKQISRIEVDERIARYERARINNLGDIIYKAGISDEYFEHVLCPFLMRRDRVYSSRNDDAEFFAHLVLFLRKYPDRSLDEFEDSYYSGELL